MRVRTIRVRSILKSDGSAAGRHDSPAARNAAEPVLSGPMFVMFSVAIAAAEAAVGLAIILMVFRHTRSTDLNKLDSLHG